jgi:adenylate cyclase
VAHDVLDDPKLYEELEDEDDRAARRQLMETLLEAGAQEDEVRAAAREGRLATLPLEYVLGGPRRYTLTEVARESKLDPKFLRQVLLSLGHPNPRPREKRYSDEDVEVAQILKRFLDAGIPRDGLLDTSRVIGQSMARSAAAVRELAGETLIEPGVDENELGLRYVEAARELTPLMGPVLQHQLNLHLREQATRDVITRADLLAGTRTRSRDVGVAFVDLSDFTRLGQRFGPDRVGAIGNRMAALATDVARGPVELVKTIGDAAMLVSTGVDPLLEAVVELTRRVDEEGEDFPSARGGVAFGPAVARVGDWFGPTVNLAARIVDIAKPNTILVDEATTEQAGDRWTFKRTRRRSLKGIDKRQRLFRLEEK